MPTWPTPPPTPPRSTVSVTDVAGNPLGIDVSWSFTTEPAPLSTLTDTSLADFGAGTPQQHLPGRRVGRRGDPGPHRRRRVRRQQPAGRLDAEPDTVGERRNSECQRRADGPGGPQRARPTPPSGRGTSLEFVATFGAQPHQHFGFINGVDFNSPWIVVSTGTAGNGVFARSDANQSGVSLGTGLQGSAHRYRVVWTATAFEFYVDGGTVPVATLSQTTGGPLQRRRQRSQLWRLRCWLDWAHVSPYPAAGSFTSRVFDAGSTVGWQQLSADQIHPAATSTGFEVRSGNVAAPDASWSSFVPVTGGAFSLTGRYLQYRATLQTTDSGLSPTLRSVTVSYGAAPVDNTAPTITARTPRRHRHQRPDRRRSVSATFSEPMDAATITAASVTLRAAGAGSDVPAAVSYAAGVASLVPNAPLAYNTVYTATVAASVADLAGNQLGTAATWSFTTEAAPLSTLTDTSLADFGAGTLSNTYLADESGGEVILAPSVGAEFGGSSLPAGWERRLPGTPVAPSPSRAASLTVDGADARTTALYSPSSVRSSSVATFSAATFQNAGLRVRPQQRVAWAVFGTGGTADRLYARVQGSTAAQRRRWCLALLGIAAHDTGIEWAAARRPVLCRWHAAATPRPVHHHRSDAADRQRLRRGRRRLGRRLDAGTSPYPAAGSFTSRVFDAGSNVGWQQLTADQVHPADTSTGFEVRSGNVAVPDGSWSSFVPVSGGAINLTGRYLQYRATLQTTDSGLSPTLRSVTVSYGAVSNTNQAPVFSTDLTPTRPTPRATR